MPLGAGLGGQKITCPRFSEPCLSTDPSRKCACVGFGSAGPEESLKGERKKFELDEDIYWRNRMIPGPFGIEISTGIPMETDESDPKARKCHVKSAEIEFSGKIQKQQGKCLNCK